MSYLFLYLGITVVGYCIGTYLKKRQIRVSWLGSLQTAVIVILVFLMGSRIGANEEIVSSLDTIGLISLAYTLIIFFVTVLAFSLVRRLLGFDRYGIRRIDISAGQDESAAAPAERSASVEGTASAEPGAPGANDAGGDLTAQIPSAAEPSTGHAGVNRLTILIVVFVAVGILAGYFLLPAGFVAHSGNMLTASLCMLLVTIGMDIGIDGTLGQNFRSAGWRVLLFPFVSMGAMLIGSALASLVLPMSLQDAACVGSGFAWYSLAPAMLAEYSTRVSAISFMHNVFREILGILLIPPVALKVGYIECYSLPGSVSMDVALPVIERATSGDVAVYSFINGVILSMSVPVLVSIFMSL